MLKNKEENDDNRCDDSFKTPLLFIVVDHYSPKLFLVAAFFVGDD